MKLDFRDLPIGEKGISLETVEQIWTTLRPSLQKLGLQDLRAAQSEVVERAKHNVSGAVLTDYGKEVAVILPIQYSKVAMALVHLAENQRVREAIEAAMARPDPEFSPLEDVLANELAAGSSDLARGALAAD